MHTFTLPISIPEIDGVLLHPVAEKPTGIIVWKNDGKTLLCDFTTQAVRDKSWEILTKQLIGAGFVLYHNVLFRPESMQMVEHAQMPNAPYCLRFQFRHNREITQPYKDKASLDADLLRISEILSTFQVIRSGGKNPTTKQ